MRALGIPAVTVALAALMAATAAAQSVRYTPQQAALACKAKTDHELNLRHYDPARPLTRLATERESAGWRVHGLYLTREGEADRQLRVACSVGGGRVALTELAPAD